jgi:hypothetical protein
MVFKRILVINSDEFRKRRRLFESLSNTYKIRFSAEFNENEVDGIISFNDSVTKRYNKPAIFYFQEEESLVVKKSIVFKNAKLDGIDYSNRTLYTDSIILTNALRHFRDDEIIAEQDNIIIWGRKEFNGIKHYYSVITPKELMDYESLKHLFFCNDIISTLPLLVFIREIIKSGDRLPNIIGKKYLEDENPVLEKVVDSDILFSRTSSNPAQAGISSITMDIISGQRLSPVKYFDKE